MVKISLMRFCSAEHPGSSADAAAGWLLATVVRIVTNLLASAGFDQLGRRFGLRGTTGAITLWDCGHVVYVLVLIPVAIAALNALRIDAISVPAIAMLQQILNALPAIFTAVDFDCSLLPGAVLSDLVTNILTSLRLQQHLLCAGSTITF